MDNPPTTQMVEQVDRDAAADAVKAYRGTKNGDWQGRIRRGEADDGEMVQAFARHRIAALQSSRPPVADELCVRLRAMAPRPEDGGEARHNRALYVEAAATIETLQATVAEAEAEHVRLSTAVCSGVLGDLLTKDEGAALADFVKTLRAGKGAGG